MADPPTTQSVWDIPRNDIRACRRYWESHEITADEWRVMLQLQDDPALLIKASAGWPKRSRR